MIPSWSRSGLAAACAALRAAGRSQGLAGRLRAVADALAPALGRVELHACLVDRRGRGAPRVVARSAWCSSRSRQRTRGLALRWTRDDAPLVVAARGAPGRALAAASPGAGRAAGDRVLGWTPVYPGRHLAVTLSWSDRCEPRSVLAEHVLEALLAPLTVLVRGALLAAALRPWRQRLATTPPRDAGTFLLELHGERVGSTRGGETLLAGIDLPTPDLADLLVTLADVVGRSDGAPAGLDEAHRLLPLRTGGQVQAIFRRLDGEPPRVLLLLKRVPIRPPPALLERLEEREAQVAVRAAHGLSNRQIGDELDLSGDSVKRHLGRVYRKLEVSGRLQLAEVLHMA